MGKHLTIKEKNNAENELKENREKIKSLREEINKLKYRNKRLEYYLKNSKKSKYSGLFSEDGLCYSLYKKKASEMTIEERREYDAITKIIRYMRKEDK